MWASTDVSSIWQALEVHLWTCAHAPRRFQSARTPLALELVVPVETVQNTMKYRAKKKGGHDDEDKPCVKRVDPRQIAYLPQSVADSPGPCRPEAWLSSRMRRSTRVFRTSCTQPFQTQATPPEVRPPLPHERASAVQTLHAPARVVSSTRTRGTLDDLTRLVSIRVQVAGSLGPLAWQVATRPWHPVQEVASAARNDGSAIRLRNSNLPRNRYDAREQRARQAHDDSQAPTFLPGTF